MGIMKAQLLMLLLAVGVVPQSVEVSTKCRSKPDAPNNAIVRCFKKYHTCRATCHNGYIFSQRGSKSAIYDCKGGKWVMRDGEDICQRINSTLVLKSQTKTKTSLDHASSKNRIKAQLRGKKRCTILPDFYHDHGDYGVHPHYEYYDYYDHNHTSEDLMEIESSYYNGCDSSTYYSCQGTLRCIHHSWVCDQKLDCPNEDDEFDCNYEGNNTHNSVDHASSSTGNKITPRKTLRCMPPLYHHEHDCIDDHYHYAYDYYYGDYHNPTDDHIDEYNHDPDNLEYHYDFYTDYYDITNNTCFSEDTHSCKSSMYLCKGTKLCIKDWWVCDQIQDCPNGDDEFNCKSSTSTIGPTTTYDETGWTDYDLDPCREDDMMYYHGYVIETILATCTIIRCVRGVIKEEKPFGNLNGCCLNPNTNEMVAPGAEIDGGGCVPEICTNSIWVPDPTNILASCVHCRVFNDPHFEVFSGVAFDWHIGCNHSLVQEGDSMNPDFGVFMDFNRFGGDIALVGPTTYKEDINTVVVLDPGNLNNLEVNGYPNPITSTTPTFLVRSDGTETTAMAWKTSTSTWSCIRLYGKPKILVELCSGQITIWAAKWKPEHPPLAGLCGSTDIEALDERKLVARNGTQYTSPGTPPGTGWLQLCNENFGLSWQTDEQTKVGCPAQAGDDLGGFKKREAANPQTVCSDVVNSPYKNQCLNIVQESGLTGTDRDMFYNTCMFDLCVVVEFPQPEILTYDDMVKQIKQITVEAKTQEDNTIEYVPDETECPFGWSPMGGQCFQVYMFNESLSLDDALQHCISINSTLAHPHDVTTFNNFIRDTLLTLPGADKDGYWLGGRLLGETMEWLVGGGLIPNDQFMIGYPRKDPTEPSNCLEIPIQEEHTVDTHPQVNCNCPSCMDISQHIDIRSDSAINAQIQIKQVVRSVNNRKETLTVKPSPNICIEPEVFVCEIEVYTATIGPTTVDYDITTTDYYTTTELDPATSTVGPTTIECDSMTTDYDTTTTEYDTEPLP